MDEQETKTQEGTEKTAENPDVGKPSGEPTEQEEEIVKKANEIAEAQKTENDRKAELLEREEKLMERKEALAKLGGGSPAGDRPVKAEETPEEYKEKVMKGEITPNE